MSIREQPEIALDLISGFSELFRLANISHTNT